MEGKHLLRIIVESDWGFDKADDAKLAGEMLERSIIDRFPHSKLTTKVETFVREGTEE